MAAKLDQLKGEYTVTSEQQKFEEFSKQYAEFRAASNDIVEMVLIRQEQALGLLLSTIAKLDKAQMATISAVGQWLGEARERKAGDEFLCMCCNKAVHHNTAKAFWVGKPAIQKTGHYMVAGVCPECCIINDDQALMRIINERLGAVDVVEGHA